MASSQGHSFLKIQKVPCLAQLSTWQGTIIYRYRGSTLLAVTVPKNGQIHNHFILMITESPDPIKDRSELVFSCIPRKILTPYASLSERLLQVTGLINAFSYLNLIITRPQNMSSRNFYQSTSVETFISSHPFMDAFKVRSAWIQLNSLPSTS